MSYELRKVAREYLAGTDLTDFKEMAAELAARIPSKHLRDALAESLPHLLATINQQRRMNNPILADASAPPPVRSAKVAGIAAMHDAALRDLVHVGQGQNKQLGDCTYEDLMFAAEERREKARQNAAKAAEYEALAERVQSAGVARVADLPPADLANLGAAA